MIDKKTMRDIEEKIASAQSGAVPELNDLLEEFFSVSGWLIGLRYRFLSQIQRGRYEPRILIIQKMLDEIFKPKNT